MELLNIGEPKPLLGCRSEEWKPSLSRAFVDNEFDVVSEVVNQGVDQVRHTDLGSFDQVFGPALYGLDAKLDLLLVVAMTGLTRAGHIEQRTADVMIADLDRAFPLVRHVAVRARDAAAGVDTLAPQLELGVLRLE